VAVRSPGAIWVGGGTVRTMVGATWWFSATTTDGQVATAACCPARRVKPTAAAVTQTAASATSGIAVRSFIKSPPRVLCIPHGDRQGKRVSCYDSSSERAAVGALAPAEAYAGRGDQQLNCHFGRVSYPSREHTKCARPSAASRAGTARMCWHVAQKCTLS